MQAQGRLLGLVGQISGSNVLTPTSQYMAKICMYSVAYLWECRCEVTLPLLGKGEGGVRVVEWQTFCGSVHGVRS